MISVGGGGQARPRENYPRNPPFQLLCYLFETLTWAMLFCFDFDPKWERRGMRIMLVFSSVNNSFFRKREKTNIINELSTNRRDNAAIVCIGIPQKPFVFYLLGLGGGGGVMVRACDLRSSRRRFESCDPPRRDG